MRSARDLQPLVTVARVVLPSGETRWFESHSEPRRQSDGSVVWDAVSVDVTTRREAEQELEYANIIVEQSPTVLYKALATEGAPRVYTSRNVIQFGYTVEDCKAGRFHFPNFVHEDDRPRVMEAVRRMIEEGGDLFEQDYRLVTPDGSIRYVDDRTTALRDEHGNITHWQGMLTDITERWQSEKRIRLLQSVSLAIAEAESFDTALATVIRHVCEAAGWSAGAAWIPSHGRICREPDMKLGPRWHNGEAKFARFFERMNAVAYRRGVGLIGAVMETRQPMRVADFDDPVGKNPERLAAARELGVQSAYLVPICVGSDVLSVLVFTSLERKGIDEAMTASVTAVAAQLGLALHKKGTEQALHENMRILESALEVAEMGSWTTRVTDGSLDWSSKMLEIFGLKEDEFDHRRETFIRMVHPDDLTMVRDVSRNAVAGGDPNFLDHRILRADGAVRWIRQRTKLTRDEADQPVLVGVAKDITDERQAERERAHAQRIEAIGNLTAGVAHDFNNILGVIIGNLDLVEPMAAEHGDASDLIDDALKAALHGAELTRSLLAYARRQPLQPQRIVPNDLVAGMGRLLCRTLGENIEMTLNLARDLWTIEVDPALLEASIINLATNARDAMPRGGELVIATRNVHADETMIAMHPEAVPGDYAVVEISDSGCGMTPEVIKQIFEPFFTTKEVGKGTGLGLSMVFGFIHQSGGFVTVYSEPDVGSTFRLYLPRTKPSTDRSAATDGATACPGGEGQTILVVEDNAALCRVVVRQLTDLGYRVLQASHSADALATLERECVHMVFSDVVMPGDMDGIALAQQIIESRPDIAVVLTSGFPEVKFGDRFRQLDSTIHLLGKPYRKDELAHVVRSALSRLALTRPLG
ncbi:MAG TPA: PAS domain-containing protein [Stellaceae bacterium]|nr:PAS domain-containing protein [Stellaceae bacterium]